MSAIISYKCSKDCGFKVRLSYYMPVWKEDTPEELRVLPVGIYGDKYVLGYRDDYYCVECRSVVSITEKNSPRIRRSLFSKIWYRFFRAPAITAPEEEKTVCPKCGAENSFLNEKCPDCKTGIICSDDRLTMRF